MLINIDENIDYLKSIQYNNNNYTLITKEKIQWKIVNNINDILISPNFKIKNTLWYDIYYILINFYYIKC